jgi:hypothetical protein
MQRLTLCIAVFPLNDMWLSAVSPANQKLKQESLIQHTGVHQKVERFPDASMPTRVESRCSRPPIRLIAQPARFQPRALERPQ